MRIRDPRDKGRGHIFGKRRAWYAFSVPEGVRGPLPHIEHETTNRYFIMVGKQRSNHIVMKSFFGGKSQHKRGRTSCVWRSQLNGQT